jgi:hypothetical protein
MKNEQKSQMKRITFKTVTGFCIRCQARHPVEMLTKVKDKYICEVGNDIKSLEQIANDYTRQQEATEALSRLKLSKK